MSQFKNKLESLRALKFPEFNTNTKNIRGVCSAQIRIRDNCSNSPKAQLLKHSPIIICKKQKPTNQKPKKQQPHPQTINKIKKVQPFVPIQIPVSPRPNLKLNTNYKSLFQNTQTSTPNGRKQIQIHIDKQSQNSKQCIKKLFKKIHKLTQDLAQSQKQRIRLQLQLNNLQDIDTYNREKEKQLLKLQGQNYKLKSDIDYLKDTLKQKNNQINNLKNRTPNQIIKQIVVEKPVQVRVQVPKYVTGPEKIIEIPKYMENKSQQRQIESLRKKINDLQNQIVLQKRKYNQLQQKSAKQIQVHIPQIVQKPVYLQKPIYIDRPIYIQKPIQKQKVIQIPIQVPYQMPVYIQKPLIDEQLNYKLKQMQKDIQLLYHENQMLKNQNIQLKMMIGCLQKNLQIIRRHNNQKNHQVQMLLQNTDDYNPIKIRQIIKKQTRIVGRSGNRLQAQIGLGNKFYPNI